MLPHEEHNHDVIFLFTYFGHSSLVSMNNGMHLEAEDWEDDIGHSWPSFEFWASRIILYK